MMRSYIRIVANAELGCATLEEAIPDQVAFAEARDQIIRGCPDL